MGFRLRFSQQNQSNDWWNADEFPIFLGELRSLTGQTVSTPTQPGYDIHRARHGISMALIEIDGLPMKHGDFPLLC